MTGVQTCALPISAGLKKHAQTLGLDEKQFDACVASGKFKPLVQEDFEAGIKAGVTGTPAFFINGILINGAQPAAAFEKIIDAELKALGK